MTDVLTLSDGRQLEYRASGPSDGPVLVFQHGTPGSSDQPATLREPITARGLRLVTFARPGYGGSTRQPGRTVADVAADTAELVTALGADEFHVAGWSGGGPHALACGVRLPERVRGVLVIAGVGPYGEPDLDFLAGMGEQNIEEFGLALRGEDELRPWMESEGAQLTDITGEQVVSALSTLLPEPDREVLAGPLADELAAQMRDGLRLGIDGWLDDDLAFTSPWGFGPDELRVPVSLWQGDADLMVPHAHGRWLAERIPGVRVHLEPGEGHLSIAAHQLDRLLDELLAAA